MVRWLVAIFVTFQLAMGFAGLHAQDPNTIQLKITLSEIEEDRQGQLLRKYRIKEGTVPLNSLEGTMESIIQLYENEGYPFVKTQLDTIRINQYQLSGHVKIEPGIRITVDSILNRTGYRISPAILSRIMDIRPGETYSEKGIREAASRLSRIEWMSQKRPLEIGFHQDQASIFVYPDKAGTNRFDGWAGITPASASSSKLAFSGEVNLGLNNLLQQGESWQLKWRRNQDRSQQLKLGLNLPSIYGLPFGFDGLVNFYRQDTSYFNLNADAGIPYFFNPDNSLSLFYRYRSSDILKQHSVDDEVPRQSFKTQLTGLTWRFNTLDNKTSPTRGISFISEVLLGNKKMSDSISLTHSEATANFNAYVRIKSHLVLAGSVSGGILLSPEVVENECFRVGGVSDLVGFDEDAFRTDRYVAGAAEVRYILDTYSYLLIRANAGLLGQNFLKDPVSQFPIGLGIGGQVKTGGGIFRIIFALGTDTEHSFQLRNGKIHIGYVGLF